MRDMNRIEEAIAAIEDVPEDERLLWIEEFCGGDQLLKDEIISLISFDKTAEKFLNEDISEYAAVLIGSDPVSGKLFGNYRVVREIGHGGMGAVYLAERTDGEFEHEVALKIVRDSIADSRMIERFRVERQILASLNHPNIAKLLDGGVSSQGEPFLAMEYVEGQPINDFVRTASMSIEGKLSVFLKVCNAVNYAHRNLVVHRDIKPGNILVAADGEPKLLDFGLAKILKEHDLDPGSTKTAFRALTPSYASPEQLLDEPITTASDVYSLGVVLYELLTGELPFKTEGRALADVVSAITEGEASAPSSVKGAPAKLKGDLDNIVLMALRKVPEERYASVQEFADDIGRFLDGRPVSARPQSFGYRASKFLRRHRVGTAAVAAILFTLIAAVVISLRQAQLARVERDKATAINSFLQDLLVAANPEANASRTEGRDTTVKDLLRGASQKLETDDLAAEPEVKAKLRQVVGVSLLAQGEYELAERNLTAALAAQTAFYGESSPETLYTMVALADLWSSRGDHEKAAEFYRQRIAIFRREVAVGRIAPDLLYSSLYTFSILRRAQGDSVEAESLIREAIELVPRLPQTNNINYSSTILALTLADQGKFDEAERIARDNLELIQAKGEREATELCNAHTFLGSMLMELGRYDEAMGHLAGAEEMYRKFYAPNYLPIGDNIRLQAQTLYLQGKYVEAERRVKEALEIYRSGTNSQYINYPSALIILGSIFVKTNRTEEGEKELREALKIRSENMPEGHFLTALAKSALGECLTEKRDFAPAEVLLNESIESLRRSQGSLNPRTLIAEKRLVRLKELRGF